MKNTVYHISEANPYHLAQTDAGVVVIAKDKEQAESWLDGDCNDDLFEER